MKRILREGARVNVCLEQNALQRYIVGKIYLKDYGKDDNKNTPTNVYACCWWQGKKLRALK